ncbi:transposase [Streptomyces luridiscabiei]|uniref:transposase n=1 Tax=Streptomyces luridiscabiei TaxID=164114 RepID=UPI003AEFE298
MSDDLWERVAPLLPARAPRRHRYPGRLPADDRAALCGIVYVLGKSVSWRDVPKPIGISRHAEQSAGRARWAVLFMIGRQRQCSRRPDSGVSAGTSAHQTGPGTPGSPGSEGGLDQSPAGIGSIRWCLLPGRARSTGEGPV